MEFTELKREIDRAISSVKNKAYEDALDYLNDVGTNLQFDIDDWLVESEEDEKSIRCSFEDFCIRHYCLSFCRRI